MVITDIKQQVKRPDRYSIYADDTYVFSLSESGLLQLGIRIGQTFGDGELESLKASANFDKLYDLTLRYVAIRLRSRWEIEQYLRRKEASPTDTIDVIERLEANRWINDKTFAEAWVSNRRQLKPVSRRRLEQELRAKRVSNDIVLAVLEEDETSDQDTLAALIERKRGISRYQDPVKLMQYLIRQGYSYHDVKAALEDIQT